MDQLPQHFLYPDPHTPIQGDLQVDPNLFMQHSHNQHCQQRYEELLSKVAEMERKFAAQIWNVQCWHCSNPQHLSPMSLQQPGIQTPSNSQHLPPTYQQQPDTQTPSQPKRCSWCRRAKEAIVSALKRAMSLTKLRASQGDDASAANTGDAGSRMLQRMKAENNFEWPETPSMLTESGMWSKASGKLATKSQPAGPGAPAQFGGYDPAELHTSFYDLAAAELEGQYLPQPAELACESRRSLQHKSSMIAPHRVRQSLPLLTKPTAAMNTESFAPSSRSSHTISSLSFPTPIQYGPLVSEALTESPIEYRNLPPTPIEQVASGSLPVRCGTGDSWKSSGSTLVAYEEPNNSYLTNQLQETQWSGKQDASLYTQGYQNDSESYTPRYGPDDFPKHPAHSRPGTWAVAKPEPRDRAVLQQGISSGIQGYGNHVGDHSRGADSSAFFSDHRGFWKRLFSRD
ncbi:hypothetical protein QBC38DRAFT_255281 [Podospora fimiseda]|uniref:Uncharacterized protein n=1 Tax=Podospora fimiseda TaxID=252190 RepID=A0AAN7BLN6_9PEZI|nr:hypothetical protein QBC38DRAFT_255281 [Podospora fimiseda]